MEMLMHTVSQWWMWVAFLVFIACMLFADFFLFGGKKTHRVSTKEALTWTIVWISLSFLFNFLFWIYLNHTAGTAIANQKSIEFLTGYLIEKSLSVDNIFVILMIFNYFYSCGISAPCFDAWCYWRYCDALNFNCARDLVGR